MPKLKHYSGVFIMMRKKEVLLLLFAAKRTLRRIPLVKVALLLFIFFFLTPTFVYSVEIPLKERNGLYELPVKINGVITLDFIVDSGASDVVIPYDVYRTLRRTGTVGKDDILSTSSATLANGSRIQTLRIRINQLDFGGITIGPVTAMVSPERGDLLLGQSALEKLRSWSLDNKGHLLIVNGFTGGNSSPGNVTRRSRHGINVGSPPSTTPNGLSLSSQQLVNMFMATPSLPYIVGKTVSVTGIVLNWTPFQKYFHAIITSPAVMLNGPMPMTGVLCSIEPAHPLPAKDMFVMDNLRVGEIVTIVGVIAGKYTADDGLYVVDLRIRRCHHPQ